MFELDTTMLYCLVIIVINSSLLLLYHFWIDPYKDIERFYFKHSKLEYGVYKLSHFIIMLSLVFSLRYVMSSGATTLAKKMK